jgi:predicted enzyme involved in methoxymalonyl-ACP biosynthesis
VLGREVERATLALLVAEARARGARALIGAYVPTAKNGMVRDLYARLGFQKLDEDAEGGARFRLDLAQFDAADLPMKMEPL